jgi:hypothetical protein
MTAAPTSNRITRNPSHKALAKPPSAFPWVSAMSDPESLTHHCVGPSIGAVSVPIDLRFHSCPSDESFDSAI